jgi:hypothetical protein
MQATVRLGGRVSKIATFEPPHNDDPDAQKSWSEYLRQLDRLLADGRRGDAVACSCGFVGTPDDQVEGMACAMRRFSRAWRPSRPRCLTTTPLSSASSGQRLPTWLRGYQSRSWWTSSPREVINKTGSLAVMIPSIWPGNASVAGRGRRAGRRPFPSRHSITRGTVTCTTQQTVARGAFARATAQRSVAVVRIRDVGGHGELPNAVRLGKRAAGGLKPVGRQSERGCSMRAGRRFTAAW